MYLQKLRIENIRSISSFEMTFSEPAGWHVILGDKDALKSGIICAPEVLTWLNANHAS